MPPPPIPSDVLYSSPRFQVVTSLSVDLDLIATYGGPTREIMVLGTSGGNLVVTQVSPHDEGSPDVTIPLPAQMVSLPVSARAIKSTTDAGVLPLLLLF